MRTAVLRGKLLSGFPRLRKLVLSLFPPADLYRPLVDLPLESSTVSFGMTHKYAGAHEAGVITLQPMPMPLPGEPDLSAKLVARVGGKIIFSSDRISTAPWWGRSQSGFTLLRYTVPEDLPLGVSVECDLQVRQGKSLFQPQLARAYVRKSSEE